MIREGGEGLIEMCKILRLPSHQLGLTTNNYSFQNSLLIAWAWHAIAVADYYPNPDFHHCLQRTLWKEKEEFARCPRPFSHSSVR